MLAIPERVLNAFEAGLRDFHVPVPQPSRVGGFRLMKQIDKRRIITESAHHHNASLYPVVGKTPLDTEILSIL